MMADIGNELDLYNTLAEELPDTDDLLDSEDDAPIIRLINAIAHRGHQRESLGYSYRNLRAPFQIRFRVDGVLAGNSAPAAAAGRPVNFAHQGMMAGPDIAEKRVPQDGRMALRIGGRAIDVRVSHPALQPRRERVVPRLLDKNSVNLDLLTLGMPPRPARSGRCADRPPARHHPASPVRPAPGKARRSTPPSCRLDARERNIMTSEDPGGV